MLAQLHKDESDVRAYHMEFDGEKERGGGKEVIILLFNLLCN